MVISGLVLFFILKTANKKTGTKMLRFVYLILVPPDYLGCCALSSVSLAFISLYLAVFLVVL